MAKQSRRLKLKHIKPIARALRASVYGSTTDELKDAQARTQIDLHAVMNVNVAERLNGIARKHVLHAFADDTRAVEGFIWNYLDDLPLFPADMRVWSTVAIMRLARLIPAHTTLLERCDKLIGKFIRLRNGMPPANAMAALGYLEASGYIFETFGAYERLIHGLRQVSRNMQARLNAPKNDYEINTRNFETDVLIHLLQHVHDSGASDSSEVSTHGPDIIILACELFFSETWVTSVGSCLLDENQKPLINLGVTWSLLRTLSEHGLSSREIGCLCKHMSLRTVLYLISQHMASIINLDQIRMLMRLEVPWDSNDVEGAATLLVQWKQAGEPKDFNLFASLGGTKSAWEDHLCAIEKQRAQSEHAREHLYLNQAQRVHRQATHSPPQIPTGNKRRHPNFQPIETPPPSVDWEQTGNQIREILRTNLWNLDPDLASATLLALMRADDRLQPQTSWPKMELVDLRKEIRELTGNASKRAVKDVIRALSEIRLIGNTGKDYHLITHSRATAGATKTRLALVKLCDQPTP